MLKKKEIEEFRKRYKPGTMVELISMDDAQAPPAGTIGEVSYIDDTGTIFVNWRTGQRLGLLNGVDNFRIVEKD